MELGERMGQYAETGVDLKKRVVGERGGEQVLRRSVREDGGQRKQKLWLEG